jgi:hypothetical protein
VPGGIAAFGWASTLSVTSFWVHPAMLGRLPAAQLAWMLLSPLAAIATVASTAVVIRRLVLPGAVLRYLAGLADGALAAATLLLAGGLAWPGLAWILGPSTPGEPGCQW